MRKKTHKEYVEELQNKNLNFEVVELYINAKTKIMHRCSICKHEWLITPNHILHGKGCPECSKIRKSYLQAKTHEEYVSELQNINLNIYVIDKYKNDKSKLLHKCKVCGCEWFAKPNDILRGCGCPKCNQSHGEQAVQQWLEKHQIIFTPQHRFNDCRDKYPLPFDFYLPQHNICIEYNGKQHYEPVDYFGGQDAFEVRQYHDQIKQYYCQKNNISLIIISYLQDIEEELNKFLLI
jgi:hypothetical protein